MEHNVWDMNRKIFALICLLTVTTISGYSQCNQYYPLEDGKEWTYENFNQKGKSQGTQLQKVVSFESTASGYEATLQVDLFDQKGEPVTNMELAMECQDGNFYFDMNKFVSGDQLKAMGDFEITVTADHLEYPANLSVGQDLEDATIAVSAKDSPVPMKITVNIINRRVESTETITTPAGTFEALKISSQSVMETQIGLKMTMKMDMVEWLAKDVGLVKSESFRKGKSSGYTLLVKND